jgi:hypothetical protein
MMDTTLSRIAMWRNESALLLASSQELRTPVFVFCDDGGNI